MKVAVVVLNWNGKHHLERFLPILVTRTPDSRIIIADGASTDGSVDYVRRAHPELDVLDLGGNWGFAGGYNNALSDLHEDIFVLLNSDVEVEHNWLKPLVDHLGDNEQHGACQPKVLSFKNKGQFEHAGAAGGFMDKYGFPFCRGRLFDTFEDDHGQYDSKREVFWATGTCLAIRRRAWEAAGGFDSDLFAHMEEIDLCWRVHRAGYKVHAIPASIIFHVGGGTLPYKHPRKTYLNFRNSLVVLVKNAPGNLWLLVAKRFVLDAVAAWKFLLEGKPEHFFAVARAHFRFTLWLPATWRKRKDLQKRFPTMWPTGTYSRSIAWQYFLSKRKRFSELPDHDPE